MADETVKLSAQVKLLNDFIFKRCLGRRGQEPALEAFVNALMIENGDEPVTNIEILNDVIITPDNIEGKVGVLDIKAKTLDGKKVINIEIQLRDTDNMFSRSTFYESALFTEKDVIKSGEKFEDMPRVITINILDYHSKEFKSKNFRKCFEEVDRVEGLDVMKLKQKNFIELPKFRAMDNFDLENALHRWLLYFDYQTDPELKKEVIKMDTDIQLVETAYQNILLDPQEMEIYRLHMKYERNRISSENYLKEKAAKEAEQKKAEETARNMLEDNVPLEKIKKWTGLCEEEILNLM